VNIFLPIYSVSNLPSFPFLPSFLPSDRAPDRVKLLQFMLSLTPHSVDEVSSEVRTKGGKEIHFSFLIFLRQGFSTTCHEKIIDFLTRDE